MDFARPSNVSAAGLPSPVFSTSLWQSTSLWITFAVSAVSLSFLYVQFTKYNFGPNAPRLVEDWPIVGALRFFGARWDFFQYHRGRTPSGNFAYFVGKNPIVGLCGDAARKLFFEHKELDFAAGYSVLFGQSPNNLKDPSTRATAEDPMSPGISKTISLMLKTENLKPSLPHLINDTRTSLEKLSKDGITKPFYSVYRIVYQLTMRTVGCDDIAENPELLETTLQLFEAVESSATPMAIMFPWFPSWSIIRRTWCGGRLYMIMKKIVDERKKSGKRGTDCLQKCLDRGDDMQAIIEFMVGALFAGLLNSGINVCWVLLYLSQSEEWKEKVLAEVKAAAAQYGTNKSATLIEQLADIPLHGWETAFPTIDLCLRDSIRLQLLGTAFRKNTTDHDIAIPGTAGEVIPPGAFVTYHTADAHMNPEIYRDPERWDPSRYLEDRQEDKKAPHAYFGWGTGRHPCLGMRFAKLEQNIITAFFLAKFDFELVTKDGTPTDILPSTNLNAASAQKPREDAYLKLIPRTETIA